MYHYRHNEVCKTHIRYWRWHLYNNEHNIRYTAITNIRQHKRVISRQLFELDRITNFIDKSKRSVLNKENKRLLLSVLKELLKWIKILLKFYNVFIQQYTNNTKNTK